MEVQSRKAAAEVQAVAILPPLLISSNTIYVSQAYHILISLLHQILLLAMSAG